MKINHITKLCIFIFTFLFVLVLSAVLEAAEGSCRIENISLKKEGNFTKVTVYADKAFEFSHSTEEAKDGKPYRVIIDCQDAIFDLPQHHYNKGLPPGIIEAIRTSQFQAVPERIVRVVLDLKGPAVYKVIDTGTEKKAAIAILTGQDTDFPMWVAVKEKVKEQKVAKGKKQTKAASTETISKKELKSEWSQALLSSTESSSGLAVSEKGETESPQKERIYRRAVCYADTGEDVFSEEKPVLLSEAQSDVDNTRMKERISQVIEQLPGLSPPEPPPAVSSEQTSEQIQSSSHQVVAKRIDEDKTQRHVSAASAKPVLKSEFRSRVRENETLSVSLSSSKQTLSKPSSPERQTGRSAVTWGPFPEDKSSPLSEETKKEKITKAEVDKKPNVSPEIPGSALKRIGGILGPEPASARESEALAESLMIIQSPQESKLGLVPQREMVFYNPGIRRDPFLPLTERQDMSFGEAPSPLFENLTLVGILKDEEGNRALLEDEVGFGYILMSGDKIKNGYVISVEDNRAIFHIEEYGGYRIMVLELKQEY
jgi:hypothetical protein